MDTTTSRIKQIGLVMVPSTDQDRSVEFYETLGFEKRMDVPFADIHRWVEVYPPEGTTGIALIPARPEDRNGVQSGILLSVDDIDATHARLRSAGVDVDAEVARKGASTAIRLGAAEFVDPVPSMFWFRDPDGNTLLIVGAN
jgi:catechol 2,3-dioxygenase-like lactoylglutathione lyase family enzyme